MPESLDGVLERFISKYFFNLATKKLLLEFKITPSGGQRNTSKTVNSYVDLKKKIQLLCSTGVVNT